MFVDEVVVTVRAGKGGDGCVAFLRLKYRPRSGPAGGDGGKGGDVVFVADDSVNDLLHLRRRRTLAANNGRPGQGKKHTGASGGDLVVEVPLGTVGYDAETEMKLFEFSEPGETLVVVRGGRGGRGNVRFATATNRTPQHADAGEKGEERRLRLELKLIADVGLVGLPNAGKSTLLRSISAARPRTGQYAFTTLTPQLGVVERDWTRITVADLPGIGEGAHRGKGLGIEFLRHIERTRVLLHLVDCLPPDGSDPAENVRLVREEIARYSDNLARRPEVLAVNKTDLPGGERAADRLEKTLGGGDLLRISALTGEGTDRLVDELFKAVEAK